MRVKALALVRIRDGASPDVIWQLLSPALGTRHPYKYRLALTVADACVMRYDNEAGTGLHRHIAG